MSHSTKLLLILLWAGGGAIYFAVTDGVTRLFYSTSVWLCAWMFLVFEGVLPKPTFVDDDSWDALLLGCLLLGCNWFDGWIDEVRERKRVAMKGGPWDASNQHRTVPRRLAHAHIGLDRLGTLR